MLLYMPTDADPQRVRIKEKGVDGLSLLCVDNGEELFPDSEETGFYSLPPEVR